MMWYLFFSSFHADPLFALAKRYVFVHSQASVMAQGPGVGAEAEMDETVVDNERICFCY